MNALIIYMLKAAVYLAGFYLIYYIFLSSDTFYGRNRGYMLFSVIASFSLPAITLTVNDGNIFYFGKTLSEIVVTADTTERITRSESGANIFIPTVSQLYLTGVILLSLRLMLNIFALLVLILRKRVAGDRIIYFRRYNSSGFSAFGYIFLNRSASDEEAASIIRHEESHISRYHFVDILLIEVAIILQWFNPFIYLFNRSLRAVHEYQADEGCLKSGITVTNYQSLLLNSILQTKIFLTSNSFSNPSLIRKRLLMMSRVKSREISNIKMLTIIPVLLFILLVLSSFEINRRNRGELKSLSDTGTYYFDVAFPDGIKRSADNIAPPPPPPPPKSSEKEVKPVETIVTVPDKSAPEKQNEPDEVPEEVFMVVEEMPQFPGSEKALMEFIYQNVRYPERAKENSIQGRVIVKFAVMADGKVSRISVLKGVDPDIDNEAIRVISLLPEWKPGLQGGKPVNVWYNVPVTFTLN